MMLDHGSAVRDVLPVHLQVGHVNDGHEDDDDGDAAVQDALLNHLQAVDVGGLVLHLLGHVIHSKVSL